MKRWISILALGGILPTTALLLAPPLARAQPVFMPGRSGGDVSFGYDRENMTLHSEGVPDNVVNRRRFDERLGIRNTGFSIFDPRLLTGNLGLNFGLTQDQVTSNDTTISQHGRLTDYSFDAGLLSYLPYSGTLFANRSEGILSHAFGGQSLLTLENRGATVNLREDSFLKNHGIRYFSSSLGVRQEHIQEETTVLGQLFQRDETHDILDLRTHKGFTTADLDFNYQATDIANREQPTQDYQGQTANLTYSLDFGPTLNRRWDSRIFYLTRTRRDNNSFKSLTADERVHLDHYENLSTEYRYALRRNDTTAGTATSQAGTFELQHRLYRNLSTSLELQTQHLDIPNGKLINYSEQLGSYYQRSLTPDHRIFASAGERYQLNNNDLTSSNIDVINEPFTVPATFPLVGGEFTLANPFVNESTIVVVDRRGGGSVTLTVGLDYYLIKEGDFTKIILKTSPAIQAGDPLEISYSYEVAPSAKFSTGSWWLSGGFDLRWLMFSLRHQNTTQTLLSGQATNFLENRRSDTAQLELRGDWGATQGRVDATYEILSATRLAYTSWRFSQLLTYQPRSDLVMALNADQSFTDFTLPARHNTTLGVRLTLNWFAPGGWNTTTFAGARRFEDSEVPSENLFEAGVKAQRRYGKLDIVPSFTEYAHQRGTASSTDMAILITVTRSF